MLSHKWSLELVCTIAGGSIRYSELLVQIAGLSHKCLNHSLERLERLDFIKRNVEATHPIHVKYSLTEKGKDLVRALHLIQALCPSLRPPQSSNENWHHLPPSSTRVRPSTNNPTSRQKGRFILEETAA